MDTTKEAAGDAQPKDSTAPASPQPDAGPPDGGLVAWLQVAGCFCLYFCTWGLIASYGSFQAIYEVGALASHTPFQISVIGSLQTFLMVFSGFVVGPIYDAGYFRHLLAAGSALIVVGTVLQSLCRAYWHFLLAQGLMVGLGAGCLSILSVALPSLWFSRRLPVANGLVACGSGLGGVVLPIMVRELTAKTSLPWTARAMALLMLVLLGFANVVLRPRSKVKGPRRSLIDKTAFTDWPYVFFVAGCFVVFLGMYTPFVHIQSFALEQRIVSPSLALYLLAILNSSSILGRILPALLAQRVGPMNMIIVTAVGLGVACLCLMAATSLARLLVVVLAQGFFTGSFFALQPTIFVRLTSDPRRIGTRFGMAFSVMSIALLFGPPVAGALRRERGYDAAWIWAGVTILVGGGLIIIGRFQKAKGALIA